MNRRRIAVVGILLAAGLGLTACTTAGTPVTSPTSVAPTLSPSDTLKKGLAGLKGQSYDFDGVVQGGDATAKGSVDTANKSANLEEKGVVDGQSLTIGARQIGTNLWVRLDLGALNATVSLDPTKWMLVDQTKVTGKNAKTFDLEGPDVMDLTGLLTSTSDVTATDATHLAGKVDLTAATGVSAPNSSDLTKAAAAAKAVPFTATVDAQGRLTQLVITADAANKTLSNTYNYSNFGSATPITAPAATDVIPAPDFVYQILNSNN